MAGNFASREWRKTMEELLKSILAVVFVQAVLLMILKNQLDWVIDELRQLNATFSKKATVPDEKP